MNLFALIDRVIEAVIDRLSVYIHTNANETNNQPSKH